MITTTYTVKMQNGDIWQFKYNLNEILVYFNVMEGDLSEKQQTFLYTNGNFPWRESQIKEWSKKYRTTTIEVGDPKITFDAFWAMYPPNPLSKKRIAKERWDKLKDQDKIKILMSIPQYIKLKTKENTKFPYAEVFINQRWWDN